VPRIQPIPAAIRKQQKIIKQLNLCSTASLSSSQAITQGTRTGKEGKTAVFSNDDEGAPRNPPYHNNRKKKQEVSLSSAGEILCCSSINSSDIRNCNRRVIDNLNQDAAQKVWRGAVDLGVTGEEGDDVYVQRILSNENKETAVRMQREQPILSLS
jgi:hypothetical protein